MPEAAETGSPGSSEPPNPAPATNGAPVKQVYDWDRTPAEEAKKIDDERIRKTPFPLPNARTQQFGPFCEYWNNLIKDPVSRYARLYVHRWFPSLLPEEKEDRLGLKRQTFPGEKTLHATDGPLSEEKVLSEVGVGDYTIRLNDTRRPFEQATILHCEKFATRRDWDHYPPLIDPERLDWDDPANQVYIKWAQSRGIFRKDDERQKDESEMANAAVVSQLLEQNKHLTEQVTREKPAPAPAPIVMPAKSDNGDGGAYKAIADLAIAALNRPQPVAQAADPMAMVQGIAGVVQTLMPQKDTASADLAKEVVRESAAVNERVFKMQEQAISELRSQIKEAAATPAVAVAPATPPTLAQQFQEMEAVMGAAKRIARGGSTAEESEEKPSKIDKWLEAAPIVAPIVGSFVNGIFQTILTGLQVWERNHYNDAVSRKGEVHLKTPPSAEKVEPGNPIPPQAPTQTAEQIAQQQQWGQIMSGVQMLAPHLVRFLDKGKSGAELAEFIIENADEQRTSYERIKHLPESLLLIGVQIPGGTDLEKFTGACRFVFEKIPALWAKVGTLPTMPQFLADFYNYDQIREEEESRLQEEQR